MFGDFGVRRLADEKNGIKPVTSASDILSLDRRESRCDPMVSGAGRRRDNSFPANRQRSATVPAARDPLHR